MAEKAGSPPPYDNHGFSSEAGGYPQLGAGGYPQAAGYPPKSQPEPYGQPYGQPGYTQQGYGQAYVQQTTQAIIVSQPGAAGHVIVQSRPADYMVASIFACLCCFWPTGLCAIYFATQANALAAQGNMAEATRMSNNARNLMITSIVIGVIWITLVIVLRVVVYSCYNTGYGTVCSY